MSKTIGVLGGMGSFATNDFVGKLLELSEPDELHILVDYAVHIPSRTRAIKYGETSPFEEMAQAMEQLYDWGADIVAVPCNSAHYWYDQMACKTWLNMIEITANAVKRAGYSKPLILGGYVTVEKKLYSEYLPDAVYLDSPEQHYVLTGISRVKDAKCNKIHIRVKDREIDSITLACTELSLVELRWLREEGWGFVEFPLFDSSREYAKAVVEEARK